MIMISRLVIHSNQICDNCLLMDNAFVTNIFPFYGSCILSGHDFAIEILIVRNDVSHFTRTFSKSIVSCYCWGSCRV